MHDSVLRQFPIRRGSHPTRNDGLCAMEMVSWLAGEEHTDDPRCACPILASYVRAFNDSLPSDGYRERHLRRLIPRLVNSRGDQSEQRRRAFRVADHGARVLAPLVMEKRGETEAADKLRRMNPITCRIHAKMAYELARDLGAPRSVLWPLMMASRNHTPVNWVPAVVHIVRDLGSDAGYEAAASMLKDILVKRPARRAMRRQPD